MYVFAKYHVKNKSVLQRRFKVYLNGANQFSGTMGTVSFRALLCKCCPCGTREEYTGEQIELISASYRLVRDELCEEVQHGIYDDESETCDRVFVI